MRAPRRRILVELWEKEQEETQDREKEEISKIFLDLPGLTILDRAKHDSVIAAEVRRGEWD